MGRQPMNRLSETLAMTVDDFTTPDCYGRM
jgi:hypothetical protein